MKRNLLLLSVLALATGMSFAQNNAISTYFSAYENKENVTMISLTGKLFSLTQQFEVDDKEMKEYQELASKVESFKMLIDSENQNARSEALAAVKKVSSNFESLVTITDKTAKVDVMIDENNGIVNELLLVIGADNEFILMDLIGQIPLKDVSKLIGQVASYQKDKVSESAVKSFDVKLYPNPAGKTENVRIELPEELNGAQILVYDSKGVQKHSQKSANSVYNLSAEGLQPGFYVVKVVKGEVSLEKKLVIE